MKIIFLKALLVISFLITSICFSQNKNDCEILNCLIEPYKKKYPQEDFFLLSSNYADFHQRWEELKSLEQYHYFEQLDSLKYKINDNQSIFSEENKDFFFFQMVDKNSIWQINDCNISVPIQNFNWETRHKNRIYISKPIYTKDERFAIVDMFAKGMFGVFILYKDVTLGWIQVDVHWYGIV